VSAANGSLRVAVFPKWQLNPYGALLYAALESRGIETVLDPRLDARWLWRERGRVSMLHFHWDKLYYESSSRRPRFRELRSWLKVARYAGLLGLARLLGYRIVWTVHEVVPHETRNRRRDVAAGAVLARASHAMMAHDEQTVERASQMLRIEPDRVAVVPHGSYVGAYPVGRPREAVRSELGLDPSAFAFLAFGHLRRYKRLELLLDAFARLDDPDVALVIAGSPVWRIRDLEWEARMFERLHAAADGDPRIRLRLEFVPENQVTELHEACDAAVLARSDGWTSGSIILAMSEGMPVLAARRGPYEALLGGGAAGWLYEPGNATSLAATMAQAAAEREIALEKGAEAQRRAQALDWHQTAELTASVMLATRPNGHAKNRERAARA
jgi:glycosyltransferase involved in cell wall biosynthesis